jgi:hypothetical protein
MRLSGSRLATAAICEGVQGQLKSTRRQIPPAVNLVPATWKKLRDRHAQGDRYDCADAAAIEDRQTTLALAGTLNRCSAISVRPVRRGIEEGKDLRRMALDPC